MLTKAERNKLSEDLTVTGAFQGHHLTFRTTWGLFSPRTIDAGSQLLLDVIKVNTVDRCLDLGCGYGPIGLALAKMAAAGSVTLVDKDCVAIDYANKNIELNRITNARSILSNGLDNVKLQTFDLVVSNIPAKVGNEMLSMFLYDSYQQLAPEGRLVIVTIAGLSRYMKRQFKEIFGNYKKLKQGKTYTVAQAVKS